MSKETLFVAISNQKGGVGKSALSVVLASYFHFEKGLNVAIVDCDSPQHSLVRMRERDKKAVSNSAYYRQLIKQQWSQVQKKAYPHRVANFYVFHIFHFYHRRQVPPRFGPEVCL